MVRAWTPFVVAIAALSVSSASAICKPTVEGTLPQSCNEAALKGDNTQLLQVALAPFVVAIAALSVSSASASCKPTVDGTLPQSCNEAALEGDNTQLLQAALKVHHDTEATQDSLNGKLASDTSSPWDVLQFVLEFSEHWMDDLESNETVLENTFEQLAQSGEIEGNFSIVITDCHGQEVFALEGLNETNFPVQFQWLPITGDVHLGLNVSDEGWDRAPDFHEPSPNYTLEGGEEENLSSCVAELPKDTIPVFDEIDIETVDYFCALQGPVRAYLESLRFNDSMVFATTSGHNQQPLHKNYRYQRTDQSQTSETKLRFGPSILMICLCILAISPCIAGLCVSPFTAHEHTDVTAGDGHIVTSSGRGDPSPRFAWWFLCTFFSATSYAAVIPVSYNTCRLLGDNAAASGLLISIHPFCAAAGYLFTRVVASQKAILYLRCLIAGTLLMGSSSGIYCITGICGNSAKLVLCLLIASRCITGFFVGMIGFLKTDIKMRLLLPEQIPGAQLIENIGLGLGVSCGPIISSLVYSMLQIWQVDQLLVLTAAPSLITVIATIPMCFVLHCSLPPDLSTAAPLLVGAKASGVSSGGIGAHDTNAHELHEQLEYTRTKCIVGGLTFLFFGHLLCQCVEIGSALILEIRFLWEARDVGFVIGFFILAALPLSVIWNIWINSPPEKSLRWCRMELSLLIGVLASFLFLPVHIAVFPDWLPILIADGLIFAMCTVLAAKVQASIYCLADHDAGAIWSAFNLGVFDQCTLLGRGFAGPLSRGVLGHVASTSIDQKGYMILILTLEISLLAVLSTSVKKVSEIL